jgi:hypothetical protein
VVVAVAFVVKLHEGDAVRLPLRYAVALDFVKPC